MLKARDPLTKAWDSIHALESGEMPLKSHWIAAVTALRSVGHVLAREDSKISPKAKKIIEQHWNYWKQEGTWFSSFIEPMRNNLLKEWGGIPNIYTDVYGELGESIVVRIELQDDEDDGLYCLKESAIWLDKELSEMESEIYEENDDATCS